MDGKKLEELMLAFMNGEFDVLVAATIIESGFRCANATIFINNANNFGLSDLHQMRGRVGRSNKKAFVIFLSAYSATDDARNEFRLWNNLVSWEVDSILR
jgi:transcription-repair coupling factor (superfamily II helicase)